MIVLFYHHLHSVSHTFYARSRALSHVLVLGGGWLGGLKRKGRDQPSEKRTRTRAAHPNRASGFAKYVGLPNGLGPLITREPQAKPR